MPWERYRNNCKKTNCVPMIRKLLVLIVVLQYSTMLNGQGMSNLFMSGYACCQPTYGGTNIDFYSGARVVDTTSRGMDLDVTLADITDSTGNLLFYTNGIYLKAGVTYSAALWYQTEYYGYNNWTDLSILYGTTQTATGQVTIATTAGPAISNVYKSLSNTFTVPTSGIYYIAVRGTGNTSSSAQY